MDRYLKDPNAWLKKLTREYENRRDDLNEWHIRKSEDLQLWYVDQLQIAHDWNEWLECLDLLESEL